MSPSNTPAPSNIPSLEQLNQLLKTGNKDVVTSIIDRYKLPFKIKNNEIVELLVETEKHLNRFITDDPFLIKLKDDLIKLAKCDDEVLITGETGTGKSTIANALIGNRKGRFLTINCAGMPDTLIESELFGHVKGAFTGAYQDKIGAMQSSNNGILFLDEIGELPIQVQAKLLIALQNKVIRKIGSMIEEPISCRFVFASNRNIKEMVDSNTFRKDLYARMSTFEIHIPPLIDRQQDILPILLSLPGGKEFSAEMDKQSISIAQLDVSLNVRSLQKYVKRFNVLGRIDL